MDCYKCLLTYWRNALFPSWRKKGFPPKRRKSYIVLQYIPSQKTYRPEDFKSHFIESFDTFSLFCFWRRFTNCCLQAKSNDVLQSCFDLVQDLCGCTVKHLTANWFSQTFWTKKKSICYSQAFICVAKDFRNMRPSVRNNCTQTIWSHSYKV